MEAGSEYNIPPKLPKHVRNTELLAEHLGFLPISFVDDVINAVNNLIYEATTELERFVNSEQGGGEETEQGIHQFETLVESAVDKNFDYFELYCLRNIFAVPEDLNIALSHNQGLDFSITKEEEDKVNEELDSVRRRLIASKVINHKLNREIDATSRRIDRLQQCQQHIELLTSVSKGQDVSPIGDTLAFVTERIAALKVLFTSVRNEASTKDITNVVTQTDMRAAYINDMVRAQIEARKCNERSGYTSLEGMKYEAELKSVNERGSIQDWQDVMDMM